MLINDHMFRLMEYFQTGGPVMLPLLLVSLIMWLLIAHRALYLRRLGRRPMANPLAWEYIRTNQRPAFGEGGAVGLLVTRFLEQRSGVPTLDRCIIDELVLSLNRSLDRYLGFIGALAAVAPLLGLLGTVSGMMATFDIMAMFGTGNARGMASGISQALITTETGLIIAIPGLYMKNFLEHRAQDLQRQLTGAGYYLRRHLREVSC